MSTFGANRADGRDWRAHLTAEERQELRTLDQVIGQVDRQAKAATKAARKKRQMIQNRATARAGKANGEK